MEQLFYESCVGGMIETLFTISIVRYFFRSSCFEGQLLFGKNQFFWKTSFFKSQLAFITFINYERVYLVEGFLHIFCSCFAFRNINKKEKKTKNKFVEIVAVCRALLGYNLFINKINLCYNVNKLGKLLIIPMFIPNLQNFNFEQSQMTEKIETLHGR